MAYFKNIKIGDGAFRYKYYLIYKLSNLRCNSILHFIYYRDKFKEN